MILYYLVLSISFFIIFLIIRIGRFVFFALAENSVGLVNELIADVDEEEKIALIQKGTNKLVVSLLKMFALVIIAFALGSIPVVLYAVLNNTEFHSLDLSSFYAILSISIGATIPFLFPIGRKHKSSYSDLSQLLHRLALNNYNLANKLFRREKKIINKRKLECRNDFVIVSGLARAGTTSLMNDISRIATFATLSYANMPFLMCPNLWAKVYKPKTAEVKERSHKDGIMIGLNSNEALEEYFFKVKANDSYIADNHLAEYKLTKQDYNDYLDYQNIIKLDNSRIYLAKNNNFLLRYKSIREFNSDFVMVIMYRDPLTHAASLMEKHQDYIKLQTEDPFVLEYMNWLGHYEFGKNQKPFVFNNEPPELPDDKTQLDYWLKIWINYYSYVLSAEHPNTLLVNYDTYCENPKETIQTILNKTGINELLPEYKPFVNRRKAEQIYSEDIFREALAVYNRLGS